VFFVSDLRVESASEDWVVRQRGEWFPVFNIENQNWGLFYGSLEQIGRSIYTKFLKGPIVDRDNN
jgi:hypothetical protein